MPQNQELLAAFVGGPYDGFEIGLALEPEAALSLVQLPVNQNVVRVLGGEPPGAPTATNHVATYLLDSPAPALHYRFQGARSLDGDERLWANHWCQRLVRALMRTRCGSSK